MEITTMTTGTSISSADARAVTRVWSECPQPVTRRLADVLPAVQGGTLPSFGHLGVAGVTQVPGDKTVLAGMAPAALADDNSVFDTAVISTMDVPFRTGRPPA